MVSKKIYHISGMPKWFSLERYEGSRGFNASDWAEQLSYRRNIQWLLARSGEAYHKMAASDFKEMQELPIQSLIQLGAWAVENEIETSAGAYIQPLRCGLVRALGSDIEQYYGLNESGNLGLASGHSVSKYFKDSDSYMAQLVPMLIDLGGSDVDIKNEFNRFLAQARTHVGVENEKTHITDSDIDRLQRYNILPYFDLMLWCAIEERSISAHVLLAVLFNDNEEVKLVGDPFIAQTLKPFYKKIDLRFIRALQHY